LTVLTESFESGVLNCLTRDNDEAKVFWELLAQAAIGINPAIFIAIFEIRLNSVRYK
jgi:hypothetical protein